jgi:CheY-like chemotaxis protein
VNAAFWYLVDPNRPHCHDGLLVPRRAKPLDQRFFPIWTCSHALDRRATDSPLVDFRCAPISLWQDSDMTLREADVRQPSSILIIEDDEPVRRVLRLGLEQAGYAVREAQNGRQGVNAFRKSPTDLVITDIYMPDRDGLDVIESLLRTRPSLKILAISGASGTMDYLNAAKVSGAACVLRKPFIISTVLAAIARLLSGDSCECGSDPSPAGALSQNN